MGGYGGEAQVAAAPLTLEQGCSAVCSTFFRGHPAACDGVGQGDCNKNCSGYEFGLGVDELLLAYIRCAADELKASSDFACGSEGETIATVVPMWPTTIATGCDIELCAWACADGTSVDSAVYFDRCGCF